MPIILKFQWFLPINIMLGKGFCMPNIKIDRASLKYKYYVTEHPECRLMTREQIISVMMKERYLTKSEAEFLRQQQKPQLPHYDFKDSKIDYENLFNLQLSGVESKSVNYIQKPPVFHKTFKDLIVKDNGQIDMNQFDIK